MKKEAITTNNESENESDFPLALCCIKKLGQFFFHTLLANLFKERYSVLLQVINIWTRFFKNTMYVRIIPLIKL